MQNFLSVYFFTGFRRIQCLSVYGQYNTQNRLRIRRKNLCVHGEDSKRHKTVYISINNNTFFFQILSIYTTVYGIDQAQKPSHSTVPFIFLRVHIVILAHQEKIGINNKDRYELIIFLTNRCTVLFSKIQQFKVLYNEKRGGFSMMAVFSI